MVPGEGCVERAERRNHSHKWKAVLNAHKSAEAIVPKIREGRTKTAGVTGKEELHGDSRKCQRQLPANE